MKFGGECCLFLRVCMCVYAVSGGVVHFDRVHPCRYGELGKSNVLGEGQFCICGCEHISI